LAEGGGKTVAGESGERVAREWRERVARREWLRPSALAASLRQYARLDSFGGVLRILSAP